MSMEQLLAHQAQNREKTINQITDAMGRIAKEIEGLGYYPENNGRVTIREVCKRAAIGYSTLKNPSHKATRVKVRKWLARLKKVAPTAKADADVIKRERTKELVEQVETIAHKFNRFKIVYDKLLEQVATLENDNTDLETENADLKLENASLHRRIAELERESTSSGHMNVIPFPTTADPSP